MGPVCSADVVYTRPCHADTWAAVLLTPCLGALPATSMVMIKARTALLTTPHDSKFSATVLLIQLGEVEPACTTVAAHSLSSSYRCGMSAGTGALHNRCRDRGERNIDPSNTIVGGQYAGPIQGWHLYCAKRAVADCGGLFAAVCWAYQRSFQLSRCYWRIFSAYTALPAVQTLCTGTRLASSHGHTP